MQYRGRTRSFPSSPATCLARARHPGGEERSLARYNSAVSPPVADEGAPLSGQVALALSIQSHFGRVLFLLLVSVRYLRIGASIVPLLLHEICFPTA